MLKYPKSGKPHIFKQRNMWNMVWVPGTVPAYSLYSAACFVNRLNKRQHVIDQTTKRVMERYQQ